MLPRITDGRTSSIILLAVVVRRLVAPTPTGSKTMGIPLFFAFLPTATIDSILREFKVPMFNTKEDAKETISSTSPISSAITGDAPIASVIFAQSFTVT